MSSFKTIKELNEVYLKEFSAILPESMVAKFNPKEETFEFRFDGLNVSFVLGYKPNKRKLLPVLINIRQKNPRITQVNLPQRIMEKDFNEEEIGEFKIFFKKLEEFINAVVEKKRKKSAFIVLKLDHFDYFPYRAENMALLKKIWEENSEFISVENWQEKVGIFRYRYMLGASMIETEEYEGVAGIYAAKDTVLDEFFQNFDNLKNQFKKLKEKYPETKFLLDDQYKPSKHEKIFDATNNYFDVNHFEELIKFQGIEYSVSFQKGNQLKIKNDSINKVISIEELMGYFDDIGMENQVINYFEPDKTQFRDFLLNMFKDMIVEKNELFDKLANMTNPMDAERMFGLWNDQINRDKKQCLLVNLGRYDLYQFMGLKNKTWYLIVDLSNEEIDYLEEILKDDAVIKFKEFVLSEIDKQALVQH